MATALHSVAADSNTGECLQSVLIKKQLLESRLYRSLTRFAQCEKINFKWYAHVVSNQIVRPRLFNVIYLNFCLTQIKSSRVPHLRFDYSGAY